MATTFHQLCVNIKNYFWWCDELLRYELKNDQRIPDLIISSVHSSLISSYLLIISRCCLKADRLLHIRYVSHSSSLLCASNPQCKYHDWLCCCCCPSFRWRSLWRKLPDLTRIQAISSAREPEQTNLCRQANPRKTGNMAATCIKVRVNLEKKFGRLLGLIYLIECLLNIHNDYLLLHGSYWCS